MRYSQEHQNKIFSPFFTTKEVGKGYSQGLSIAYFVITKQHQGSIEVENEPGKTAPTIRVSLSDNKRTLKMSGQY